MEGSSSKESAPKRTPSRDAGYGYPGGIRKDLEDGEKQVRFSKKVKGRHFHPGRPSCESRPSSSGSAVEKKGILRNSTGTPFVSINIPSSPGVSTSKTSQMQRDIASLGPMNLEDPEAEVFSGRPVPPTPRPPTTMGIEVANPLQEYYSKIQIPICEAWMEMIGQANVRFPAGQISTAPKAPEGSGLINLFGKGVLLTIMVPGSIEIATEKFIGCAEEWLLFFETSQYYYSKESREMSASKPGEFIPSRPFISGIPSGEPGRKEYIPESTKGYWSSERVKYNKAVFLTKLFENCPSSVGKLNMAATILLMTLSLDRIGVRPSRHGVTIPQTITIIENSDELYSLSCKSIRALQQAGALMEGSYTRLHKVCDDIFRHLYIGFRYLHSRSPLYYYTPEMRNLQAFRDLSEKVDIRDEHKNVLARNTPMLFQNPPQDTGSVPSSGDPRSLNKENLNFDDTFEIDENQTHQEPITEEKHPTPQKSGTREPDVPYIPYPPAGTPNAPLDHNYLVCCTFFPHGYNNITENIEAGRNWEDQLFWYLVEWYSPVPGSDLPDPVQEYPVEAFAQLSTKGKKETHTKSDPKSSKPKVRGTEYTVSAQHLEAHIEDGYLPAHTPYGEPYPHSVRIIAQKGHPLPSPHLVKLHRAISIAATFSGAWGAGDAVMAASQKKYCKWCDTDTPHYCLPQYLKPRDRGKKPESEK
ncbi:hypothetical protein H072_2603 [Dactylellina haptotyla CBS 200.50]|uniref:Uncharacterized protein n=1 Tax=Dactylellina haptotyla (strain CBS 200.50) TaxID=1284197 RepID=S8BV88_DACHA|nr:hypothetical protein H072_2603 [Dactylellina haptotyla CBS 200.50]